MIPLISEIANNLSNYLSYKWLGVIRSILISKFYSCTLALGSRAALEFYQYNEIQTKTHWYQWRVLMQQVFESGKKSKTLLSTTRLFTLSVHWKLTEKTLEKCNTLMSTITNEFNKQLNPQSITQRKIPIK